MFFIIPIVAGLILYAIVSAGVRAPGQTMAKKFVSLGELKGKSLADITSVAGDPISTANMGNGKALYQWAASGFRVALMFEGQTCVGISSVYGANVS
jgi:hypothetical protein